MSDMIHLRALCVLLVTLAAAGASKGVAQAQAGPAPDAPAAASSRHSDDNDVSASAPLIAHHQGAFGRREIRYTSKAGRLPILGPHSEVAAQMFYVAYTEDGAPPGRRPVTFVMNGGPGSATAWLHIGALGPKKIALDPMGAPLPLPVRLVDNPESPLDRTDLVFVDAPGTGFSRVADDEEKKRLFNKDGDIAAFADFIQGYLNDNNRWGSPLYLFGESYGGTRAAGLSDALVRRGIPVKGVVLLSSALDFLTLQPTMTNDLPYILLIPSYAAVAQYHGRVDPALPKDTDALLAAAATWAKGPYAAALMEGAAISPRERAATEAGLARFTGLKPDIIATLNLRIDVQSFQKFLQADRGLVTGRVDGRLDGPAPAGAVEEPWYDPAMGALTPAYSAAAEQYLREVLGYKTDDLYRMYWAEVSTKWTNTEAVPRGEGVGEFLQTLTGLQSTIVKNPDFRVLVMGGIYDLAAPFSTTEWDMDHMPMTPALRRNIIEVRLPAGHMAYDDAAGLREMSAAARRFYDAGAEEDPSGAAGGVSRH